MPTIRKTVDVPVSGADDRERVLNLEAVRQERDYKTGWLYYKCRDAGLLDAYNRLQDEGLIEGKSQVERPQVADNHSQQLTIELVPKTCWFSNVRSEVSKENWGKLKRLTFLKAANRCEVCGGCGPQWPVECHELWHYDDKDHKQTLTGLIALCPACHEVKHIGFAGTQGREEIAAQHLAKVNGWSAQETEKYIQSQFAVWERRSKHQWVLDVRWLEQFGMAVGKTRQTRQPPSSAA